MSAGQIADALIEAILTRTYRTGDRLPSERALSERYGVSRTVVREALHTLAALGLIEARVGRGLYVAQVAASDVASSMRLFVHTSGDIPYETVHEVRALVEPELAALAARRGSDADLAECERALAEQEAAYEAFGRRGSADPDALERLILADLEFHAAIARAAKNQIFLMMLDAIKDVLVGLRRVTMPGPGNAAAGLRAHRAILAAVVARDADAAHETMARHLEVSLYAWSALDRPAIPHPAPVDP